MSFALSRGASIASAFERLEPEPDQIGTPRLAAVLEQRTRLVTIGGARPRSAGSGSELHLLGPTAIEVGKGLLIATYMGNPKSPSPWSEPRWIEVVDSFEDQLEGLWSALGDDYRIAIAGKGGPRRVLAGARIAIRRPDWSHQAGERRYPLRFSAAVLPMKASRSPAPLV
jgi:hypothetical protein